MKTISEESGRLIWLMNQDGRRYVELEEICEEYPIEESHILPFGAVIDVQGRFLKVNYYGSHGLAIALLHPDLAEEFGVGRPRLAPPHMAYQEFEIEWQSWMPVIRISTRNGVYVSHGRCECWPSMAQINTLRRYFKHNDLLDCRIVTNGVDGNAQPSGQRLLQSLYAGEFDPLYNQNLKEKNQAEMAKNPGIYEKFDPKAWGYE